MNKTAFLLIGIILFLSACLPQSPSATAEVPQAQATETPVNTTVLLANCRVNYFTIEHLRTTVHEIDVAVSCYGGENVEIILTSDHTEVLSYSNGLTYSWTTKMLWQFVEGSHTVCITVLEVGQEITEECQAIQ